MTSPRGASPASRGSWLPWIAAGLAFAVYAATAARTITWWDGSSYPLAAVTLGIPGAPGSLLLTLLGWVVAQIPVVHPVAFRLDLFAGLMAAALVGVLSGLGARLATPEEREPGLGENLSGALAGLIFGCAATPWTYATQFTPYVLSELWTALILLAALAWWRRPETSSGGWQLFLIFLLFGLDLSVHRTNLLLLPAALLWISIRSPRSRHRLRDGAVGMSGFALGVAFHLLLIPIAAARPAYLVEDTSTWAGWWSYVTIEQKGGGFLISLFPRTASFFSVQLADYLVFLRRNLGAMFFLPAALAVLGWLAIVRQHPRRALGWLAFFLCAGPGAVVYFNLPQHYMRPIDRHYLPSLVILTPWIAVGAAALLRLVARLPGRPVLVPGLAVVGFLAPLSALSANYRECDLSRHRFAEGFARDLLVPLPANAILLTNGDNDTLPLWYLQQVEDVRRDVLVVNLPLTNTGAYVAQLRRKSPDLARLVAGDTLDVVLSIRPAAGPVTTVVDPRTGLGLPAGVAPPDTVRFHPVGDLLGQDRVALDILRLNRWRRPVLMACTVAPDNLPWLHPFARLDGLAWRVVPTDDPTIWDVDHFRAQLLTRVRYAGLADTTIRLDETSRLMGSNYAAALFQLALAELHRGRLDLARSTLSFMEAHTPPARIGMDPAWIGSLHSDIEAKEAQAGPPGEAGIKPSGSTDLRKRSTTPRSSAARAR